MSIETKHIVRKRCPYCSIVLDGDCIERDRKTKKIISKEKIENDCDCSEEEILNKARNLCRICGARLDRDTSKESVVRRFCQRGNWCQSCDTQASKDAKVSV